MPILHFFQQYYTILFVWLSACAAAFMLSKKISFKYRLFCGLIIFLSLMETIANIMAFYGRHNHFLFNILMPINFFGVSYFFYFVLHNNIVKKITRIYLFVFPLFALINVLWIQDFFSLATYSFVFGGTFVLLLAIAYLWQLYNSDETTSIFRDPVFWISLAYLFYCAVSVPYLGMLNYLWEKYPRFTREYYNIVYDGANIISKLLLTMGFLCMKPIAK